MNYIRSAKEQGSDILSAALRGAVQAGALPESVLYVEVPIAAAEKDAYGDFASPIAFLLSGVCKKAPAAIAEILVRYVPWEDTYFENIKASAGFVNFTLGMRWYAAVQRGIEAGHLCTRAANATRGNRYSIIYGGAQAGVPSSLNRCKIIAKSLERLLAFTGADTRLVCFSGNADTLRINCETATQEEKVIALLAHGESAVLPCNEHTRIILAEPIHVTGHSICGLPSGESCDMLQFYGNLYPAGTVVNFYADLLFREDWENLLYRLLYTQRRISRLLERADAPVAFAEALSREGRNLMKALAGFSDSIVNAAYAFDPSGVSRYILRLLKAYETFTKAHQNMEQMSVRYMLLGAVKTAISVALDIIGVSASADIA